MSVSAKDLHVIRCYERLPPLPGGMERHIAELTAAQRRQGVRVTEIYNRGEPAGEAIRLWRGLEVDRIRPYWLRAALFYLAAAHRHLVPGDARFRVVHVHGDWPAFLFGSIMARAIGADAIAASLHSTTHAPIGRYKWALRRCDPVFTTGARQARQLSEALGRPVLHVPSAPADLFFEPARSVREAVDVVAVGSLLPVKNLELFLECAGLRPDLKFAIIGTGPEGEPLRRRAAKLRLQNVEFLGAMTAEQVRSVLRSARLFMNTSLTEGSPTAALEAMACGLPVVLTPGNDYGAIVDQGVTGRVTNGWDAKELVEAVDELLRNPHGLGQAKAGARRIARLHRWKVKAEIVTSAMIEAAEKGRGWR